MRIQQYERSQYFAYMLYQYSYVKLRYISQNSSNMLEFHSPISPGILYAIYIISESISYLEDKSCIGKARMDIQLEDVCFYCDTATEEMGYRK